MGVGRERRGESWRREDSHVRGAEVVEVGGAGGGHPGTSLGFSSQGTEKPSAATQNLAVLECAGGHEKRESEVGFLRLNAFLGFGTRDVSGRVILCC